MPKTGAVLREDVTFALDGKAEVTVILETCLIFVPVEVFYHVVVVCEEVIIVVKVVRLMGLSKGAPRC